MRVREREVYEAADVVLFISEEDRDEMKRDISTSLTKRFSASFDVMTYAGRYESDPFLYGIQ